MPDPEDQREEPSKDAGAGASGGGPAPEAGDRDALPDRDLDAVSGGTGPKRPHAG